MIYAGVIGQKIQKKNTAVLKAYFTQKNLQFQVYTFAHLTLYVATNTSPTDHDILLQRDHQILMGRIFEKENYSKVRNLDVLPSDFGQNIFHYIWGKFIYIDIVKTSISIIRDPTGQLDCFYTQKEDSLFFASSLELLEQFSQTKIEYDWNYLCTYVKKGWLNTTYTPFLNYQELPVGCKLHIDLAHFTSTLTSVWQLSYQQSHPVLEKEILEKISSLLKNWVTDYDEILLDLSGGIDSSSLLCLLNDIVSPEQSLKAINFFHPRVSSSNELEYAEALCAQLSVPLIRHNTENALPFNKHKNLSFKPSKPSSALSHIRAEQSLKELTSQDNHVFISGHGGDHIFLCPPLLTSAGDAFLEKGLKASLQKIHELSNYFRIPLWKPYFETLRKVIRYYLQIKNFCFLNQEHKKSKIPWITHTFKEAMTTACIHPVFQLANIFDYPPGKFDHLELIYNLFSNINISIRDQYNPIFYPLAYTPALELAFSIPTYELFQQGYDRFPLRKAIYNRYEPSNIWRTDKGETSGVMQLGFAANLKRIKELALDGKFSQNGFVHKDTCKQQIESYAAGESLDIWPILQLLSAEIFLEYWT